MTSKPKTIVEQMTGYQTGSPFTPDAPPFKEGEASTHALGVLYQAPWDRVADGFNEHARRCARALALTGCPVHLRGFGRMDIHGAPKPLLKLLAPLLDASIAKYSVRVQQIIMTATLAQTMGMHRFLTEDELRVINYYRVIYSVFERDRVSPEIATVLNRMGQVWVACNRNVDMLERCGVDRSKIKMVPVPYFDDDPLLKLRLRTRQRGVPRFYHIGKWEPRKAQDKILAAFMMAFKPREASFILKTSAWNTPGGDYPQDPEMAVAKALMSPAVAANGWTEGNWKDSIELISRRLTDEQLLALHRFGDVYVTLSRGEGFDMPAFDAKLAGNRMVYTPSGGPSDFAAGDDLLVPEKGSVPCHLFYDWSNAEYLDYDIEDAVQALRGAVTKQRYTQATSLPPVPSFYRAENVGKNMLRYLGELMGENERVY